MPNRWRPRCRVYSRFITQYEDFSITIPLDLLQQTSSDPAISFLVGVLVGLGAPPAVAHLSGMETVVTLWSGVVASAVSLAVGIVFGIYPARQAAKLNPIEALRHS